MTKKATIHLTPVKEHRCSTYSYLRARRRKRYRFQAVHLQYHITSHLEWPELSSSMGFFLSSLFRDSSFAFIFLLLLSIHSNRYVEDSFLYPNALASRSLQAPRLHTRRSQDVSLVRQPSAARVVHNISRGRESKASNRFLHHTFKTI